MSKLTEGTLKDGRHRAIRMVFHAAQCKGEQRYEAVTRSRDRVKKVLLR